MLNIVRRSQLIGLVVVDSSTTSHLGEIEEVWLDDAGRVVYFSGTAGFLPLEQVAGVSTQAIWTYGKLPIPEPMHLYRSRLTVQSRAGKPLGWIEDLLFDWQTGEIAAYILAGDIAAPLGGRAVLDPEDVDTVEASYITIREDAAERLRSEKGLQGFLSEKSHQVRNLVKLMSDRLHHLITPHDHPEVVRVKIQAVGDEFAETQEHDHPTLKAAIAFLQDQWHHLQDDISRASRRTKTAFESAWRHLSGQR